MPIQRLNFHAAAPAQPGQAIGPSQPAPGMLVHCGPVIQVLVEVPPALAAALQTGNLPVPTPVHGLALIDTGATKSAVAETIAQSLGIQPSGIVNVGTAAGMR